MLEHKKYALLENNTIEPLYYDNDKLEQRRIEKEGKDFYLYHDKYEFKGGKLFSISLHKDKIIQESDDIDFLKRFKEVREILC